MTKDEGESGVSDAFIALQKAVRREIAANNNIKEDRTLAELLIYERERQGLTLQDVADRMGTAKTYVWQLENGDSKNPSVQKVSEISDALGVSVLRVFKAALNTVEQSQ